MPIDINFLDEDPAYQCWSETIQKESELQQDAELVSTDGYQVIDLSDRSWNEILNMLATETNCSNSEEIQ